MHTRRIALIALASGGLGLLAGCGDESKTTGTQLQMSPERKAEIEGMRSVMKQERAGAKEDRAARRAKRGG